MTWASASAFYHQFAVLVRAGLPPAQALEHAGVASGGRHRRLAPRWAAGCAAGRTLAEQLAADREPAMATALVAAGEASGRLPEISQQIAAFYDHCRALRAQALARAAYPLLMIHCALVVPMVPAVVLGRASAITLAYGPLALWGGVAAAMIGLAVARRTGFAARVALLPGVRAVTAPLVVANACLVLAAGVNAGMLVPRALELAADGCGNRIVGERLRAAASDVLAQRLPTLSTALARCGFPPVTVQLVANGEVAGSLAETLTRAAGNARDQFAERSAWAARIATGTLYGAAMLLAVLQIFSLAMDVYVRPLQEAMHEAE